MSVFASGFIGETNLVQGTVVKAEDLIVTLAVGEGKHLKAKGSLSLIPGTRATMSVRPEAIRVTIQDSSENLTNGVSGRVAEIVCLGSRVRIG